jgi:hypothetical protein
MPRRSVYAGTPVTPFDDPAWRADLGVLSEAVEWAAQAFAAEAEVLERLARAVPREAGDERGGSPWNSFVREVAVARQCSDMAARITISLACDLVRRHPVTFDLLGQGQIPVPRARALVEACDGYDDELTALIEHDLAERACRLAPWRIRQEAERIALAHDPSVAAEREAHATADRTAAFTPKCNAQAEICLTGPAIVVTRWWDALTDQARAVKAAGDPRTLAQIRFDIAMQTDPRGLTGLDAVSRALDLDAIHRQHDPTATGGLGALLPTDARCTRPVQAIITVPVTTALGLSNEPGWLDGYGWISAPQSRQLLTIAELRKACISGETGQPVDLDSRLLRPAVRPSALHDALVGMATGPHELSRTVTDVQPQHDPSPLLAAFVAFRDRYCDGPAGTRMPGRRAEKDHEVPWPHGPTVAHNLTARAPRTHQLKHAGWSPVRTRDGTTWTSPAGQVVDVPHHWHPPQRPAPGTRLPEWYVVLCEDAESWHPTDNETLDLDDLDLIETSPIDEHPTPAAGETPVSAWPDDPPF